MRMATLRAPGKSLLVAAAVVRMLPRVASHMPRKPIEPEARPPARNARVRERPEAPKPRAMGSPPPPGGLADLGGASYTP